MKITVIGSGSLGNTYILDDGKEALILDAGMKPQLSIKEIEFDVSRIVGMLVTHVHGDHSKYIKEWQKQGIDCYTSSECVQSFVDKGMVLKPIIGAEYIGHFLVQPFALIHDVPCCGFLISHDDFGKMLYITDTEYIPQNFSGLNVNHVLVESNYSKEFMEVKANTEHVLTGHMELETTMNFIKTIDSDQLYNVILCHLSSRNADKVKFLERTKKTVNCNVYVAERGLSLEISNSIF